MQFNSFNMDDDVTFTNLMCHKCITTKKKKKKRIIQFQLCGDLSSAFSKSHFFIGILLFIKILRGHESSNSQHQLLNNNI